jgi:hypothetical protein
MKNPLNKDSAFHSMDLKALTDLSSRGGYFSYYNYIDDNGKVKEESLVSKEGSAEYIDSSDLKDIRRYKFDGKKWAINKNPKKISRNFNSKS